MFCAMWANMFLLIACLFLVSCNIGNQSVSLISREKVNKIQEGAVLRITLSTQNKLPLDDIFQEYYFIPLETQDLILLKDISSWHKIIKRDSSFYISDIDRVYVFNSQGRFERFIDHQGDGPHSYVGLVAFTLDANGDVFILDRARLYVYSQKDDFKYHIKGISDLNIMDITFWNDSLLLARSDMTNVGQMIHLLDKSSGQVKNSYFPVRNHSLTYWRPMFFHVIKVNSSLACIKTIMFMN